MSVALDSASAVWTELQVRRPDTALVSGPARSAEQEQKGRAQSPRRGVFALALLASALVHVTALAAIAALGSNRGSDWAAASRPLITQRQAILLSLLPPHAANQTGEAAALLAVPAQSVGTSVPLARTEGMEPAPVTSPAPPQKETPATPPRADPYYFELRELSQRPQLVSLVEVEARTDARPAQPGRLLARVLIGEQGSVEHVQIDESDLPSAFEQAAIDAFLQARYTPGQIDGRAVRSQIRIEVSYDGAPAGGELLSAQAGSAR